MNQEVSDESNDQLQLCQQPSGQLLPLSPGELNQLDTRRAEWRRRQRLSRANRRAGKRLDSEQVELPSFRASAELARRVEQARAAGIDAQVEALRAKQREQDARLWELSESQSPILFEWIKAHYRIWAAIFLGGHLASRVFDRTDGKHLTQPLPLVFEAARDLHQRGKKVDVKSLDRELKKAGVVLLPSAWKLIDDVLSYSYLPRHMTLDDVDEAIFFSKEA